MKPTEIKNALSALYGVAEREELFFKEKKETKFTPAVAIAIAKNRKTLEEELKTLTEIEEKNKQIAESRGKKLEEIEEQKQLMQSQIGVEIKKVPLDEIGKCRKLTSSDYYALAFMTEEGEKNELIEQKELLQSEYRTDESVENENQ